MSGQSTDVEVKIDQQALVNMLSRYPGTFDVLRELIQNADDADAHTIEIHFQTVAAERSQFQSGVSASGKVCKWIIKNDGPGLQTEDWERLGRIAAGNKNSAKVGAFGVGFYSVLSKSDEPLVKSNGESLRFYRGHDGKLRKHHARCSTDSWTSVEMKLRQPEQLPLPVDLPKFLVSSLAFLTNIGIISVYLDTKRVLHIQKEVQPQVSIEIPQHLKSTTSSQILTVESIQHTVQKITVDAAEWAFPLNSRSSSPILDGDDLVERARHTEKERPTRAFRIADTNILKGNAIAHDLYTAITHVDPDKHPEMKEGVESSMKSLPSSFKCKAVYFNPDHYHSLANINNSESSKAKHLVRFFFGPHGIIPENDSGRLFIGQSTNQTTGIGLHISAHFLPTMERGTIDLATGQVKAWNEEVLWVSGFLARVIYEEKMQLAAQTKDVRLGLCTMDRFAFGSTVPHSGVSQILQDAFFTCGREPKSPFPVVSDTGISCALSNPFRQISKDLSFLKSYRILHEEVEPRQRSHIIDRYAIPKFTLKDIVQEFKCGVLQDALRPFFGWWEDFSKDLSPTSKEARNKFCDDFASHGVLHLSHGITIRLENIKHFTFFPLRGELSPPDTIYIDISSGVPTKAALERFHWTQLPLLHWLGHACSEATRLASSQASGGDADADYRILRILIQFALVEDLTEEQWAQAAELVKDLRCIPTNMGPELPSNSYFDLADVCGCLPVAEEGNFLNIQPTLVAAERGFEPKFVDSRHVRRVLGRIGVRSQMDWEDMVQRLESDASKESNYRLLRYLAIIQRLEVADQQQLDGLKEKKIFCSESHGLLSATELLLPNEDVRNLGLPILALRRDGATYLQEDVDSSGSFVVETFIETLGIQKYPALDKIIAQAASDVPEVRRAALQYLLDNLETQYKAYRSENFTETAFIPTQCGSLSRPNEVFSLPIWQKLGFEKVSEELRRELLRLGVKEGPTIEKIIDCFETPKWTLPDLKTAALWFETLHVHGQLPISKRQEQLSELSFVPVKRTTSASSESSIQYFRPKDCFIASAETKHYRDIFTFVDFGPKGNEFLKSCGAKESPEASDIVREMRKNPQGYMKALGSTDESRLSRYLKDLRTVAAQLDSISYDDKQAMKTTPMFLGERHGVVEGKLLSPKQVPVRDWAGHDFVRNVLVAPKDDVLEKMYRDMGSAFLGTHVEHVVTVDDTADDKPPFSRDQVILRIRCLMGDKNERTEAFSDHTLTDNLQVGACKSLTLTKVLAQSDGVVVDPATTGTAQIVPVETTVETKAKAGIKKDGESYTLWMVSGAGSLDLRYDIAVALCHVLLKAYRLNDVLLLASLFEKSDKSLKKHYEREIKSELRRALWAKAGTKGESNKRFDLPLPRLSFLAKLPGVHMVPRVGGETIEIIPADQDVQIALKSWGDPDPDDKAFDPNAPSQGRLLRPRYNKHCRQPHTVRLEEQRRLQDKETKIKFYLASEIQCQHPPLHVLKEFVEFVSKLARVFGVKDASKACFIFWKDTDDDLMAFNRDQQYIFFNLAHYCKFFHFRGVEPKKTITEWYLIMAHELAHNITMEHDDYHGSLAASLAVKYFSALREHFGDIAWESEIQPQSTTTTTTTTTTTEHREVISTHA